MARNVAIGKQSFEKVIRENCFYVDKTAFIKEWWDSGDEVTLINRPRRFGKTLSMSMVEQFFSTDYAGRKDLFENLFIWNEEKYRRIQGTYPVIFLSFADVKERTFQAARNKICQIITNLYEKYNFLLKGDLLSERERSAFLSVSAGMKDYEASLAVKALMGYLARYYGKNVIVLLDEYDTPLQEAYVNGFWDELVNFTRSLFDSTFKTNPYLERAIMTGITRISKESVFSDLNNLKVVTTTSDEYSDCFGFTEQEVESALEEYGRSGESKLVKFWYDGFTFGRTSGIYNPWSIINYLDTGKLGTYWANTSSNNLVSKLIREGSRDVKQDFEALLQGRTLITELDEQIIYDQLDQDEESIWSLLLASGYLKVKNCRTIAEEWGLWRTEYELELTNFEVKLMFQKLVKGWFGSVSAD